MAYNITLTNGEPLVTISDGTIDVNFTSLSLVGKNYAGYGQLVNENFVHLLENFANPDEPTNALTGQIWYDTNTESLKVRSSLDGWKTVGSTLGSGPSAPTGPSVGEAWWDTIREQLYVWTGTEWKLIGPLAVKGLPVTGSFPAVIKDSTGNDHVVIKFYVNDTVTAIWSKETADFEVDLEYFIPNFSEIGLPFIIRPGLNMAKLGSVDSGLYSGVDANTIWGTAENALNIDGVEPDNFFRKDSAGGTQTVENLVEFENAVYVGDDVNPLDDNVYNLGSAQAKFKFIYANTIVADSLTGAAGIVNSDGIPEGEINRYFTTARETFVRNWTNITDKPSFATVATSGSYTDLTNRPNLFDGSYNSLINRPDLTVYQLKSTAFSGNYADLNNKPSLATVATSGSYADLINKPTIPPAVNITGSANQVIYRDASSALVGSSGLVYNGSTLTCSGDIVAFSDAALKENITIIENPLEIVRQLRGVFFDRIDLQQPGAGVIADNVEAVIPRLVKKNQDGIRAVNYNGFAGVFIEAIKALEDEIERLKKQLNNK